MSLHDQPFWPIASRWTWQNTITIEILRKHIGELSSDRWALAFFQEQCAELSPEHGSVYLDDEFDAKNICLDHGTRAVGTNAPQSLPGVYWTSFFGAPYCELIGRNQLLSAPAHEVREVGSGILVIMSEKPEEWNTPDYQKREQRFLDHVGREYFFERDNPDKPTKSPFNLPPLAPHDPAKDIHVLHQDGGKFKVLSPEEVRDLELRSKAKSRSKS